MTYICKPLNITRSKGDPRSCRSGPELARR